MKKKLVILGLAGALLFSGLSVSAAANECGHPAVTYYYDNKGEIVTMDCPKHLKCTLIITYGIEYATCHYCFKTFETRRMIVDEDHITRQK